MNRQRYTRQSIVTSAFYQLPKFLFDDELSGLSNDARVLYAMLRNRHEMSIKNGWFDENDEVYLYFKREDMQNLLHLSGKTITKAMNALKEAQLLEEVRQGMSKPNKIYLLAAMVEPNGIGTAEPPEDTVTRNIYGSRAVNSTVQEPEDLRFMNRKVYASRPVDFTHQDPEDLRFKNHKDSNHNKGNAKRVSESAPAPTERVCGEFRKVHMPEPLYAELIKLYGQSKTTDYINRLDQHIASTGKQYADHYATIRKWMREDEQKAAEPPTKPHRNRFSNFEGRKRDYAELERLEREYLINAL